MISERMEKQIQFIVTIDELKNITRQSVTIRDRRHENDAEHSWHLAMMAMILSEYAEDKNVDIFRVIKMVLIHDLVEIYAGDTYCYDEKGYEDKDEREQEAANRLFNMLPEDQAQKMMALWREFEEMETEEAAYAATLDRFQPLLLNYNTDGHTWQRPGITSAKVLKRTAVAKARVPQLYEYIERLIQSSIERGFLKP
ncbi:putative HD superfamily hydrolase [Desulfitobacterium dichloroeliminans LMG P-21439]|uniref:Putative HD superfamily hydrolase n=1 Tax=Desulfitobacterium dichloroeliminans (strain LMG P-21439 / DCA1) TaxID=871963 RepID=L0F9N4_DESDL|nr:HD domain-containing protein [Desulfitobacterium dichloroeliminans]AGA69653.1 putative HD superfamily hydrolase [Desulfitobacterium dichloroeliminans LMG P-21439]